jgi:glutamyl/glutaminyl-tRNA synthetase
VSKANSSVDYAMLEYCIRDDLKLKVPRMMAVLDPIRLVIDNYPEDSDRVSGGSEQQGESGTGLPQGSLRKSSTSSARISWKSAAQIFPHVPGQ